jgi:hypothetical protein
MTNGVRSGPFPMDSLRVHCMPLGAAFKTGSTKARLINDASFGEQAINKFMTFPSLSYESLDIILRWAAQWGANCLFFKFDVSAAFNLVPIRIEDRLLFGEVWHDGIYIANCLVFGAGSSPAIWEESGSMIQWILKHHDGLPLVVRFVDDFGVLIPPLSNGQPDWAGAYRAHAAAKARLGQIKCPASDEKFTLPMLQAEFLGVWLDFVSCRATVTPERLVRVLTALRKARLSKLKRQELESLRGVLYFITKVVPQGRCFLFRFNALIRSFDRRQARRDITTTTSPASSSHRVLKAKGTLRVRLGLELRRDIQWWLDILPSWPGLDFSYELPWSDGGDISLDTDASFWGMGCICDQAWITKPWSNLELEAGFVDTMGSMPNHEMNAVAIALHTLGGAGQWRGKRVTVRSDCMPVQQALSNLRAASPRLQHLMRVIMCISARGGFHFRVVHIPGKDQAYADPLSRNMLDVFWHNVVQNQRLVHALPTPALALPILTGY